MDDQGARRVMTADAVFDALAGLLLLSGTWDGFFRLLDLPQPKPALLAQLGGAALLGFAYLLWVAARDRGVRPAVARAGALANGLGALVILVWFVFEEPDVGPRGTVLLAVIGLLMAFFAFAQARMAGGGAARAD